MLCNHFINRKYCKKIMHVHVEVDLLTIALFSLMFSALFSMKLFFSGSDSGALASGLGLDSGVTGFDGLARLFGNFMATRSVNDLRVFLGGEHVSVSESIF